MVAYHLSEEVKTILAYILYGLSWISWLLLLGGLSGVQSSCDTIALAPVTNPGQQIDPISFSCSSAFAYMWWILVLQFLWLLLLGYLINKSMIAKWRTVIIAMQLLLAIKGVLFRTFATACGLFFVLFLGNSTTLSTAMDFTNQILLIMWEFNTGETETTRLGVAAAGQIMLFICNFLLLISIAMSKLVPLITPVAAAAPAAEEAARTGGAGSRPASRVGTPHSRPMSSSSSKLRPGEFTVPVPV